MSERRALLTDREREIITGEADVQDSYRYQTISRVRSRLDRLEDDLEAFEQHGDLADELRGIVCKTSPADGRVPGETAPEEPADPSPVERTRPAEPADTRRDDVKKLVTDVVDAVAAGWDDTDERLEARKNAAKAVLEYAVESGEFVGQSDAVEKFRDQYPVEGQNETTWWKQNARKVLTEVGDYSRGKYGYRVERDDLEAFLGGENE